MMIEPLWPPKPKLFDIVGPGSHARPDPVTRSIGNSGSTLVVFAVGGIMRCCIESTTAAASNAPAAPRAWPVTPLVDTTGTAPAPNTSLIAAASAASFNGVEVP